MNPSEKYSAEPAQWQDEPVIKLRDIGSGSEAMIAPALGSNCVAFTIQYKGETVPVVETPAAPQVLHERGSRGGVPVLFPFPGRVRNARYKFNNQEYHLPATEKSGVHHIHGVVLNTAWEVAEYGASEEGAFVVTKIGKENLIEEFRQGYPFDFVLSLRIVLRERQLTYHINIENKETSTAIPFGFGLHPYLHAPLVITEEAPDRSACLVRIPASKEWPTEGGLPTGAAQPVSPRLDFQEWRTLGNEQFDDMYSGVILDGDWSFADYRSPGSGLEVRVRADRQFHDWVFFTPPNRPSLAIEPYTCPPNAINMAEEGIPDSNLLVLSPGQSWQGQVIIEVL